MPQLKSELTKIGFTEQEAQVYEVLVSFGHRTIGQLAFYTQLPIEEIEAALQTLIEKNYVKKIPSRLETPYTDQYIPLSPRITVSADIANQLNKGLKSISKDISDTWETTVKTLKTEVNNLLVQTEKAVNSHAETTSKLIRDRVAALQDWTDTAVSSVTSRLNDHLGQLISTIGERSSNLQEIAGNTQVEIEKNVTENISNINTTLSETVTGVLDTINAAREKLQTSVIETADKSETAAKKLRTDLQEIIQEYRDKAVNSLEETNEKAKSLIEQRINAVISVGKEVVQGSEADYDKAIQATIQEVQNYHDGLKAIYEQFDKDLAALESQLDEAIRTQLHKALEAISEDLQKAATDFEENTTKAQDQAISQLLNATELMESQLTDLRSKLTESLQSFVDEFKNQTTALIDDLKTTVDNQYNEVTKTSETFRQEVTSSLQQTSETLATQVNDMVAKLGEFMKEATHQLGEQLDTMVSETSKTISTHITNLKAQAEKIKTTHLEQADQLLSKQSEQISEKNAQTIEQLNQATASFQEKINTKKQAYQESATKLREQLQNEYQNFIAKLDTERKELNKQIEDLKQEVGQKATEFETALDSDMTALKDEMTTKIENESTMALQQFESTATISVQMIGDAINQFFKDFNEASVELRDSMPQRVAQLFTDQRERLRAFESTYKNFSASTMKLLNDLYNKVVENQKGVFGKKKEALQAADELDRIRSQLEKSKKEIDRLIRDTVNDIQQTQDELLDRINKAFTEELDQLQTLIGASEQSIRDDGTTLIKNLSESVKSMQAKITEIITGHVTEYRSKIQQDLSSLFSAELTAVLDKAGKIARGETIEESSEQLGKAFLETTLGYVKQTEDQALTSHDDLLALGSEWKQQLSAQLEQNSSDLTTVLSEFTAQGKEQVSSTLDQSTASFDALAENINSTLKEAINTAKENMNSFVSQKQTDLEQMASSQLEGVKQSIETSVSSVGDSVSNFNTEMRNRLNDLLAAISDRIKKSQEDQKTLVDKTLGQLNSQMDESLQPIQETKSTLSEEVNAVLEETRQAARNIVETATNQFEEKATAAAMDLGELKTQLHNNAKTALSTLDQVTQIKEQLNERLLTSKGSLVDDVTARLDSFAEGSKTAHLKSLEEIEAVLKSLQTAFDTMNSDAKSKVVKATTDALNVSTDTRGELRTSIEKQASDISKTAEIDIRRYVQSVIDQLDTANRLYKQTVDSAKNAIESGFNTESKSLTSSFESNRKDLINKLKSITADEIKGQETEIANYTKVLKEFNSNFKNNVSHAISESTKSISTQIKQIPDKLQGALDETGKALKLLQELAESIKGVDPLPVEHSYVEVGKDAIASAVHGILQRTKTNVLVVTPTLDWLNPQWFREMSRRKRITITTNPLVHKTEDKRVMKDLSGIDNIVFRQMDARSPQILFVGRDTEEIILGTPVDSPHPHALVSIEESIVSLVTGLVAQFGSARVIR